MTTINLEEWVSGKQAAQVTGFSVPWVYRLGERGEIATVDTPLGRLYKRADVEKYKDSRQGKAGV